MTRPLDGIRIVITRPRKQGDELAIRFEELGATPLRLPLVRTRARPGALEPFAEKLERFDWIVFASRNAVRHFFDAVDAPPAGVRCAAVGRATEAALECRGISPDLVPPKAIAESLVEEFARRGEIDGRRILLPRASAGRRTLPEGLRARGAIVEDVAIYDTVAEDDLPPDSEEAVRRGAFDAIVFASPSAVRAFVERYGPGALAFPGVAVAAIGPVTADALASENCPADVLPETYDGDGLVDAIVRWFKERSNG